MCYSFLESAVAWRQKNPEKARWEEKRRNAVSRDTYYIYWKRQQKKKKRTEKYPFHPPAIVGTWVSLQTLEDHLCTLPPFY